MMKLKWTAGVDGNLSVKRACMGQNPLALQVCWKSTWNDPNKNTKGPEAVDWGPFKKLPNVRKFKVEISNYDEIFLKHGVKKRLQPKFTFERYNNQKLNRYMEHQLKRMHNAKSSTVYWRVALHLMRRSSVFLIMAISHVFPRWHRDQKLHSVISLARKVKFLASTPYQRLDYRRVYIEKSNGKLRPLGVPSPAWRVYLHMLNQLLVFRLDKTISDAQHGFRPGRGTLTAWEAILSKVINAPDIFEFDLKSYFDLINLDWISAKLLQRDVPPQIVRMLYFINTCAVTLPRKVRMNEFEHMMKALLHKGDPDQVINHPRPLSYMYRVRGVPQGAPTSPFLAAIALDEPILGRGIDAVQYADDGVYYGDLKDTPLITPNSGIVSANIHFNLAKSSWVKRDGVWLKPLKFLGLTYDGTKDKLYASTRGGATLEYDKQDLISAVMESRRTKWDQSRVSMPSPRRLNDTPIKGSWEEFIKSSLSGFIQARLYSGSWNLEEFVQNFELDYAKGSWVDKYGSGYAKDRLDVFNSTSFASYSLSRLLSRISSKRRRWTKGPLFTQRRS